MSEDEPVDLSEMIARQFHPERLEILEKYLLALPAEALFYLGLWENQCGSASCALGHACWIPEFRSLGLQMLGEVGLRSPAVKDEEGVILRGYSAGAHFFGLTGPGSSWLFAPGRYDYTHFGRLSEITARDVAERIRQLLNYHQEHATHEPG